MKRNGSLYESGVVRSQPLGASTKEIFLPSEGHLRALFVLALCLPCDRPGKAPKAHGTALKMALRSRGLVKVRLRLNSIRPAELFVFLLLVFIPCRVSPLPQQRCHVPGGAPWGACLGAPSASSPPTVLRPRLRGGEGRNFPSFFVPFTQLHLDILT